MKWRNAFPQHNLCIEMCYLPLKIQSITYKNYCIGETEKCLWCFFLDNQNQLIAFDEMFKGTINRVEVHPREIVRQSIKKNATSIILAHNHPSGICEPSLADKQLTEKIFTACQLVGVKVLDHLVIGHDNCVSFAERGWL